MDAYNDILETVQDDEVAKVRNIWEQVCGEWSDFERDVSCLLYTSPSPRDGLLSRMPSSA